MNKEIIEVNQPPQTEKVDTLDGFLRNIDRKQNLAYSQIRLFDESEITKLTDPQKKWFVKVFYHTRGHFDRLLWTRLVNSTEKEDKIKILTYIAEEAGLEDGQNRSSHEKLFEKFANSLGVNLTPEVTEREGNLPFVQDFNFKLINWFKKSPRKMNEILFGAYEKRDNGDYEHALKTAKALGVSGEGLDFFEVHRNANHFEKTSGNLQEYWNDNPNIVKMGFQMIYANQLQMWQNLSDTVFSYQS